MVCTADRKSRGFRPHPISWRGSRATVFCRCRTIDDHVLLFPSREGPTPLRSRRGGKTRPRRSRVRLVLTRLRPQDYSARPSGPQGTSSGAAGAVPKKRGGRKHLIACSPELVPAFKAVLQEHTAGDPMKPDCLWTNLSMQAISRLMTASGFPTSAYLVEQLLDHCKLGHRQAFKYLTMRQHKDRHQQFDILNAYKQSFLDSPNPIISIDTKKKEVLGLFYRKGRLFTAEGREVFDHDFLSFSKGTVIPHGIYDLKRNRGYINLGTSHDTSAFACASIFQWWIAEGRDAYSQSKELLLQCDGGGSNSASQYLFKEDLQRLVDRMGITIRVAH